MRIDEKPGDLKGTLTPGASLMLLPITSAEGKIGGDKAQDADLVYPGQATQRKCSYRCAVPCSPHPRTGEGDNGKLLLVALQAGISHFPNVVRSFSFACSVDFALPEKNT